MKILGINALNHDAAVAMIQDGEVLFAGHSERYSGVKNDSDLWVIVLDMGSLIRWHTLKDHI